MRVGLVVYGDLNTVSGGYLYDRQLVLHLQRQGDTVEVFSQEPRRYAASLLENLSGDLIESVLDAELDVLLQDELNHPSLIIPNRRWRGQLEVPIVSIVHHLRSSEDHPRWQSAIYRRLERQYLRSVDGFIFNGETTKAVVQSVAGDTGPAVVAPPGGNRLPSDITPEEIEQRCHRSSSQLRLVFLGSVIPRKALHVLLDALSGIPRSTWELSVIGRLDVDEQYTAAIKRQIQEARVTDNVTLFGPLPDREIARLLRSADVLAVPSSYEGYGIAYLEAMAFGLPALATTSGAAWEVISHNVNGWLVPPGNPDVVRDALESVRNDRERLTSMSLAARERFLEQPTWDESMSRVRTFLQTMTGAV